MISGTSDAEATSDEEEENAALDPPSPRPAGPDVDAGDAGDADAAASPADTVRAGNRTKLLVVVVAVLVVAALIAASMAAVYKGRLDAERRRDRNIRNVSAAMVTALMTYDFSRLDESRNRVLALATGRFKTEYDQGSAPLREVLTQTQSRSTGTVKEVFVGDTSSDSAHSIVVADQVLTGVGGTRAMTGQQLSLTLVRTHGGAWKVDGLSVDAGAGDAGSGGQSGQSGQAPAGSTPAPTTAPSTPPTTG